MCLFCTSMKTQIVASRYKIKTKNIGALLWTDHTTTSNTPAVSESIVRSQIIYTFLKTFSFLITAQVNTCPTRKGHQCPSLCRGLASRILPNRRTCTMAPRTQEGYSWRAVPLRQAQAGLTGSALWGHQNFITIHLIKLVLPFVKHCIFMLSSPCGKKKPYVDKSYGHCPQINTSTVLVWKTF